MPTITIDFSDHWLKVIFIHQTRYIITAFYKAYSPINTRDIRSAIFYSPIKILKLNDNNNQLLVTYFTCGSCVPFYTRILVCFSCSSFSKIFFIIIFQFTYYYDKFILTGYYNDHSGILVSQMPSNSTILSRSGYFLCTGMVSYLFTNKSVHFCKFIDSSGRGTVWTKMFPYKIGIGGHFCQIQIYLTNGSLQKGRPFTKALILFILLYPLVYFDAFTIHIASLAIIT